MLSIDMAQAHNRDLLDASAAAYAVRGAGEYSAERTGRCHRGEARRRTRGLTARLRAR
jgi:hypothetical protein